MSTQNLTHKLQKTTKDLVDLAIEVQSKADKKRNEINEIIDSE